MDDCKDWSAINIPVHGVAIGGGLYCYPDDQVEEGLAHHPQLSKDLPGGLRALIRKDTRGLGKEQKTYLGTISTPHRQIVEETADSAAELLDKLRAASAILEPQMQW